MNIIMCFNHYKRIAKVACFCGLIFAVQSSVFAGDLQLRQAKRIHDRLTGIPPDAITLGNMESALNGDATGKTAADIALLNPAFYNVTLKNFVAPWTNEEQTVFTPLNDYTATAIGLIRDDLDFRQVLFGDILYIGNNAPAYSVSNNDHYEALEALGPVNGNLANTSVLVKQTQSAVTNLDSAATAGVITTRAAARAFFIQGTNRAMFRFTMMNHLCTDLEPIKDNTRTPDRVHRDVSRSPGGDSRIYLNSCVGCHAGMDGLLGAYANYNLEFTSDSDGNVIENTARLGYTPNVVQEKFLINENNFKQGHVTQDDSWINYWRNGQNSLLGWSSAYPGATLDDRGNAIGKGAKSMGMELAYSDAFAQCQVKKVFKAVCFRDPDDYSADRITANTIKTDFIAGGYKMKQVFRDVAASCKGDRI